MDVLDVEARLHTIAVVDDDPSLGKALARLLSVFGYGVELFASAPDFLSEATRSQAQCMVVDIDLGDASGLDLVRQLSSYGFRIPTIFMSGSQNDSVLTQCRDLGGIAFLRKPFAHNVLMDAISKAVGSSRDARS